MLQHIYTYRSPYTDAAKNQAIEAFLTEWVPPDACVLYLWQNNRTVVIGRNQNAYEEVRIHALEADGGFLARRLSGGGAVYHDLQNLNFTFAVRDAHYDLAKQLQVIIQAVAKFGLKAEFSGRNDILLDGRKFSGNAFYHSGDKRYHHGTLLIDVDGEAMAKYLSPPAAKLSSKGVKSVRSRVVNLKTLVPDLNPDVLASALNEAFAEVYSLVAEPLSLSALPEQNTLAEWEAFFLDRDWRMARLGASNVQAERHFPWGNVHVELQVSADIIEQASIFSDAMDGDWVAFLAEQVLGCKLEAQALSALHQQLLEGLVSSGASQSQAPHAALFHDPIEAAGARSLQEIMLKDIFELLREQSL